MRFNARLINSDLLIRVLQSVEKISKECIMHFTTDRIQFILSTDIVDGVQVWSGISVATLFDDYVIESMNNNEIAVELNLDNLNRALKSSIMAQEVRLKLVKKNSSPFLTLLVAQPSNSTECLQDIPIRLLTGSELSAYVEPRLPDPEVHILLPRLQQLRTVVDRLKNISDRLAIRATMGGELIFKVEHSGTTVYVSYRGLEHPQIEGRAAPDFDPEKVAEVTVDVRKFSRFLYSYQVVPQNVICCIVKDQALVLHVLVDDLYLTYYISVTQSDQSDL